MPFKIQRGRQFLAGDATAALFDEKGKSGAWLKKASEALVAQGVTVQLQGPRKATVTLKTADDWSKFLSTNAFDKNQVKQFANRTGISFQDFCNVIDDAAASGEKGFTLDLRPTSELAKTLSLDKVENDYAAKLAKDQVVKLTGDGGVSVDATAVETPAIGPSILDKPIGTDWERDRAECEAWADFKIGDGAQKKFKDNTGVDALGKLNTPKWDDPEAMALIGQFTMPLHVEETTDDKGVKKLQDHYEMFRDQYYDDPSGALSKAGAAVRARVRFDNNEPFTVRRVLIQAKEGRAVDGANSVVHKFEKRFEGTWSADEAKARDLLVHGQDTDGSPLKVAQMLYKLAKDKSTLPADGTLHLEPKSLLLQKRRRSHVQFESLSDVTTRRDALKKDIDTKKTANEAIPPAMQAYADKLDQQVAFLTEAKDILSRYNQYLPSGTDGFIISADRYSVYDPKARSTEPTDVDDETGRIGRGLHLEAEWDTASSDPFQKATAEIQKRLAATPPPADADKAQLEKDLKRIDEMSTIIRADVAKSVEVVKQKVVGAGVAVDDSKKSKEDRAADFVANKDRVINWL